MKEQQYEEVRPMTLEEVGAILGVTRERVRQIEAKALKKLRRAAEKKHLLSLRLWNTLTKRE